MVRFFRSSTVVAVFLSITSLLLSAQNPAPQPYPGVIKLAVDASDAPAKIFHATLTIPVKPGHLTLLYPKWIPGEHAPDGPIEDLTGLRFTANGQNLIWRRDDVNMFAIHLDVPQGVNQIEASLDYTSPAELEQGFTGGSTATAQMAVLSWNWVLLYPDGYAPNQIQFKPSLRLPAGWQFGTALPVSSKNENEIEFQPTTLYTLVDSPVISGQFFRVVHLTAPNAWPPVEMDIAADSEAALQMSTATEQHYKQLVAEATSLFGATHYRDYHFLLSLSDHVAHFGLEHHESNDSRTREDGLISPQGRLLMAGLLPHEYTHSWNGKYRRPAGLATPGYQLPMKGEMLWVYEGLTDYYGNVLSARAGLRTPEQYRDYLALTAATMQYRSGRKWRPLLDTTIAAQVLYGAPRPWTNWRRSVDFYPEGDLIWLEADMTIRKLTGGRKSLDDFCKLFEGAPTLQRGQVPMVKPYTFDDVVNTLNEVAPYNWRKFFEDRLWSTSPNAPLEGVQASGWKLAFDDTPSEMFKTAEDAYKVTDLTYSLGLLLSSKDGRVVDVVFGSPAAKAGIAPGMIVEAMNGRAFTPEVAHEALKAAMSSQAPMEVLVRNTDYYKTVKVDYHGGNRYPHLVRDSQPDSLTDIIKQHAATAQ